MSQNQNFYDATPTEDVFDVFKKLSFEKWSLLPDGSFSPEYFEYSQDGKDGSVERYINHDGVKELKVLALLRPSSNGNSTIKHKTDKIDDIRGRYIRVSVTAKSENIAPDAIQVTMQDGTGKSISKFYQNGGNWEHLELITDIDKQAEYLQLTCTIKSFATADVLFESIKIEVLPQNDSFDYTNITSSETVFDEYKNFLFHNYSVSADTNYDEYKKFTFEKWVMLPDNNLCPEQFVYKQDKSGGSVERHIFEDEIEGKKVCAFVSPSSDGNSLIMHQTDQIDNLRGRYIRVSAMVKSDNTTSDAIQIDVKDGTVEKNNYGVFVNKTTEVPILKSYENSGTWECIELIKFVGKKTQNLIFTCNVQSTATAGAYFDWVKIDVMTRMGSVPHDKNNIAIEFEGALKSRRWSSFLLPKKYFELIHADIPISSLVEMFAIDKPVFQFKKGYVKVEESGFSDFLSQLGSEKALNLLEESVIIFDEKLPPSLHKLRIPKEEYARENQEFSTTNVKKLASPTGVKRENDFQLSVERYEYDSCDLRVSTDNDGILYWADGYDTGWCAYVDEKEVPVYRANKNFKAIAIPKGTSSVSFVYDPSLFKAGLNLFYGTLVVCFLSMLVSRNYHCMRRGRSLFLFKVGYGVICGMIKVCFFVVLCLFFVRKGRSSLKSYLLSLYKRASSKIE
ncbi:MAG: hypothetical protein SCALA701_04500 [Candidatus Scalindua sp.]|nr:MAG: hypothetical protein SCALA701_04500 [Candidatus Scalindua sp.]